MYFCNEKVTFILKKIKKEEVKLGLYSNYTFVLLDKEGKITSKKSLIQLLFLNLEC